MEADFGMGITGKWINKLTGQVINVRNSVIDGDDMIIISDAGQLTMAEFSQNYIQASDEIYNEQGQVINTQPIETSEITQNNLNQFENQFNIPTENILEKNQVLNENDKIIEKVFKKINNQPQISVNITWDDFPKSQLNTLIDFLDIPIDDISKYIIKKYFTDECIAECVSKYLSSNIS